MLRLLNPLELHQATVLVTATSFGKRDPELRRELESAVGQVIYNPHARPLEASELIPLLAEADGIIAGLDHINAEVIAGALHLRVIARYGAGVDRVDLEAASEHGIAVTNTPGANSTAVAELAVLLILALARSLIQADRVARGGSFPRLAGIGLVERTVGIIGLGDIGMQVAQRLRAFGCRLVAYDPYRTLLEAETAGIELASLPVLLEQSDFVTLHAPALPETRGMVNAEFLAAMKPGAFFVNTARGELIDEDALAQALASGHLAGAALDCFQKEPPPADHPLLQLPQVIVTPHTGAQTDQAVRQMGQMALQACLDVLRGKIPEHIVNKEILAK